MTETLLVVDVQECFLNEHTRHIPGRVADLIRRRQYDRVLMTQFVNTPDSPYQRLLKWYGCQGEPEFALAKPIRAFSRPDLVFVKRGLTGLPKGLADYLEDYDIESIDLVGIDTDMCVLKVALDLFDRGIAPIILTDCCASTAGLQAHFAGLAILSRNVGAERLHLSGLSQGEFGAPAELSQDD